MERQSRHFATNSLSPPSPSQNLESEWRFVPRQYWIRSPNSKKIGNSWEETFSSLSYPIQRPRPPPPRVGLHQELGSLTSGTTEMPFPLPAGFHLLRIPFSGGSATGRAAVNEKTPNCISA